MRPPSPNVCTHVSTLLPQIFDAFRWFKRNAECKCNRREFSDAWKCRNRAEKVSPDRPSCGELRPYVGGVRGPRRRIEANPSVLCLPFVVVHFQWIIHPAQSKQPSRMFGMKNRSVLGNSADSSPEEWLSACLQTHTHVGPPYVSSRENFEIDELNKYLFLGCFSSRLQSAKVALYSTWRRITHVRHAKWSYISRIHCNISVLTGRCKTLSTN